LIGRVCSDESCSAPFVIGGRTLVCPAELGVAGELQLWINNYVQVDGYQTRGSYARMAGGYRFQAEPADASACEASGSSTAPPATGKPPADGEVLRSRTYVISSRQNAWKPFFFPLDRPLTIRATGDMQPHERARGTGPNGIAVPDVARWVYPGTKTVVVDADHWLIEKSLPYQALIGRLCSASACGDTFLVGTERTICPDPSRSDRLELWVNHIVPKTEGLTVPFADLTFQGRRGEYRFEVTVGAPGACR
jgi:hypothetical protein